MASIVSPASSNPSLISPKPRRTTHHRPTSSVAASTAVSHPIPSLATPTVSPELTRTSHATRKPTLAAAWREIQGSDDWEDLVNPLSPLLRDEIVRYGELVLACYKAFDLDASSSRYLNCKHAKARILAETGTSGSDYKVTKYIYATPGVSVPTDSRPSGSRWIGYVAVSTDDAVARLGRRDVVVSFRGTVTTAEWMANLMSSLTPARFDPHEPRPDVKVESGFLSVYTSDDSTCKFSNGSCREQLLSEVSRIINNYRDEEVSITLAGHSMGSSLALLLGYDLAELGLNRDVADREIPITVYSFGGPRVGNAGFKERCEEFGVKVLRVVNVNDVVTKLPGVLLNENFRVLCGMYDLPWSCSCYAHVGVELALDFFKMKNPICVHDLDAYLGLLKCPKKVKVENNDGIDLLDMVKGFLMKHWMAGHPWQNTAGNLGGLFESLRSFDISPWLQSR